MNKNILFFIALSIPSFPLLGAPYLPEKLDIILLPSAENTPDWQALCPQIGKRLVVRSGPWSFGFFSRFECRTSMDQVKASDAPWLMTIETRQDQTLFEIKRKTSKADKPQATTTIPFHEKNLSLLSNPRFADVLAVNLLEQLPAVLYLDKFQKDLIVPELSDLAAPTELKLGSLESIADSFAKKETGTLVSQKENQFIRFDLQLKDEKNNAASVWGFYPIENPERRLALIDKLIQIQNELLHEEIQEFDFEKFYFGFRYAVSLLREPAILSKSRLVDIRTGVKRSSMNRWSIRGQGIPSASSGIGNLSSSQLYGLWEPVFYRNANIVLNSSMGIGVWNSDAGLLEAESTTLKPANFDMNQQPLLVAGVEGLYQMNDDWRIGLEFLFKMTRSAIISKDDVAAIELALDLSSSHIVFARQTSEKSIHQIAVSGIFSSRYVTFARGPEPEAQVESAVVQYLAQYFGLGCSIILK